MARRRRRRITIALHFERIHSNCVFFVPPSRPDICSISISIDEVQSLYQYAEVKFPKMSSMHAIPHTHALLLCTIYHTKSLYNFQLNRLDACAINQYLNWLPLFRLLRFLRLIPLPFVFHEYYMYCK